MNKYFIIVGESLFQRWGKEYIAYSTKSIDKLQEDENFLSSVDEALSEMYYEFAEEGKDYDEFVSEGSICEIRLYKEEDGDLEILYDERNE